MSRAGELAPTRLGLLRAQRRLGRVRKGVELLRRKRQALVVELFGLAQPAAEERARIAAQAERAYAALLEALAARGLGEITAIGWPSREVEIELRAARRWGVITATVAERPPIVRTLAARGTAPASTGPAIATSGLEFEMLIERLLDAAPRELTIRRLGAELARTSRQLGALEHRVGPALAQRIAVVRSALDEREREERMRLRRLLAKS